MWIILSIGILSLILNLYQYLKIRNIKVKLENIHEVLDDIQSGNGNRKILAVKDDLTSDLAYKINEIVEEYEKEISGFKLEREANKELMTSLSHDLRTPLTTLIGYLDAIDRGVVTDESAEEYFQIARMKADDLKEYIDVLFEWFKLQSSEFDLFIEKIDINELTRQILVDWIPIIEEHALDFEIDIADHPVYLQIDQEKYQRVMNNLIQNVINHSEATEIKMKIREQDSKAMIVVYDNGVGIEKAKLPNLFERLYKVDRGRSQKGSGLGLAISKQMVEIMEGEIEVESEKDQYTEFTITFPISQ